MSITAILTVYKRPYSLLEQLEALHLQSISPEHIIIWKNAADNIVLPEIPEYFKDNLTIIDSSTNFGVWARFAVGLLANTEFICVFDDDTIPQPNWFKNCLDTMKIKEGLLGTNGIILDAGSEYKGKRVGWDAPNEDIEEVDFITHCWFFKRKWLNFLWEFTPDYNFYIRCGEDIMMSVMLQKNGIKSYIPPHPINDLTMYGSHPFIAIKYGNDINASIAMMPGMLEKFGNVLKYAIDVMKFKTIANEKLLN